MSHDIDRPNIDPRLGGGLESMIARPNWEIDFG